MARGKGTPPTIVADLGAFLNDPATGELMKTPEDERALLAGEGQGETSFAISKKSKDGEYRPVGLVLPTTRVMGVMIDAVRAYVRWRNKRAEEAGDPWVYDLPTEYEFEKAARGTDGRAYTWGARGDANLCLSQLRASEAMWVGIAPPESELRDESPYGVLAMTGCRWEFVNSTRTMADDAEGRGYMNKSGCWRSSNRLRVGDGGFSDTDTHMTMTGFRLVAKRR